MPYVILAFGSNISIRSKSPVDSLLSAVENLSANGLIFKSISSLYLSPSIGASYQPSYYNCVAYLNTSFHSNKLLTLIKQLERASGRKGGLHWGARPLDIDIIDFNGEVKNWHLNKKKQNSSKKNRQSKVLPLRYPHKEMHKRAFVLKPLAQILPLWRHPVMGFTPAQLLSLNCSPLVVKSTKKLEIKFDL